MMECPFDAKQERDLYRKIKRRACKPVPNHYSKELRERVDLLLSLDPNLRPSISDIENWPQVQAVIRRNQTRLLELGFQPE